MSDDPWAHHYATGLGPLPSLPEVLDRLGPPESEPGEDTPPEPPEEPMTELGYARRLIAVYGGRLRYVPAWRRWLVWDGTRWAHDTTGQAAAVDEGDRPHGSPPTRWRSRTRTSARPPVRGPARRVRRTPSPGRSTLAGTEPGIVVTPDDLDADPFLLNCANGTLDLRTGELRGHDPADLLTKMTGAAYEPGRGRRRVRQVPGHASSPTRRCAPTWPG